jgi:hypothetical protein
MRLENPEKKQGKSIIDFPLFCHKVNHNGFEEKKHQEKGCRWVWEAIDSVYRRRTDNTMAKRKKYKSTNNDLQNIPIQLKIE